MNRKRIRQMNTLLLRRLHKRPAAEFFEHREAFLQTLEQENFMQRFAPLLGEERLRCKCVLELCREELKQLCPQEPPRGLAPLCL